MKKDKGKIRVFIKKIEVINKKMEKIIRKYYFSIIKICGIISIFYSIIYFLEMFGQIGTQDYNGVAIIYDSVSIISVLMIYFGLKLVLEKIYRIDVNKYILLMMISNISLLSFELLNSLNVPFAKDENSSFGMISTLLLVLILGLSTILFSRILWKSKISNQIIYKIYLIVTILTGILFLGVISYEIALVLQIISFAVIGYALIKESGRNKKINKA